MFTAIKRAWGYLLLFFTLVYLLPVNFRHLWQPDETRYAEISREMLQRGDWVNPHFLGLRYFEKPVAGYWINNLSQMLFGDSNFAVRFGSVLSTGLSALLVFWLATLMWRDRRKAFSAVLIYLSCTLVFSIGTYSVLDPMITLWMNAAMLCSFFCLQASGRKQQILRWIALGLVCGMGFITKGFLALALPVIAVLPVVWREKKFRILFGWGPVAVVSALLISLPWVLAIAQREPDFWRYFFWVEHIQRFAKNDAQHSAPVWYYLPILCLGCLPWLGLLPSALLRGWKARARHPELFFLLSWVVMPLLFFSIAKGKLLTYILPCFAPLALLMGNVLTQSLSLPKPRIFKINGFINLVFGVTLVLLLLATSSHLPLCSKAIYAADEDGKLLMAILCFAGWALAAVISLTATRRWYWAAVSPLLLVLLVGQIIPQHIIDSKQPQAFILKNLPVLRQSRFVLSDNVGVAAGLAWELKRGDILLFNEKGELEYGLAYPEGQSHYISTPAFALWLAKARTQGSVALMLWLDNDLQTVANLPAADSMFSANRLKLLVYNKQT